MGRYKNCLQKPRAPFFPPHFFLPIMVPWWYLKMRPRQAALVVAGTLHSSACSPVRLRRRMVEVY